ncbi:MAG: NADH-quinone oxidoreductase subunit J [Ignavibacteriales bacterium]|jgi:NADH:ubiquinone oxidoreductase subunit 6 (chain J)|nr:MAG: NADH-quinone oxidoreductase subunit J [Ignavibacteriaceae bacterium]MBW7872508.1 NADH-quinone oxidoreductase subunit J [Ignavibacteria bacterium]MCZ2141939.1 NADH-quinone oxidoreductase subunit J [Ignavibacteriales bacterium]OQY73687.1 MAG: NADH-quinone oxidoreductase subunit J [Ignavibacteriales bacterium UTCHB3]MBV6445105.1 NADH-quinone oxidoreductase subunit J [Ignavibacteriaceae bacterium]
MTLEQVLFGFFALVAVVSAVMMITGKNPVVSALFLVLNFGALSGTYVLLRAQFIAVVQIIVYAGAIMVLFLFVLMLLRPDREQSYFKDKPQMKLLAIIVGVLMLAQIAYAVLSTTTGKVAEEASRIETGTIENIGRELYTTYLLPFEAIAFVLLTATLGALVLSKKKLD